MTIMIMVITGIVIKQCHLSDVNNINAFTYVDR